MQEHQNEAGDDGRSSKEAQELSGVFFGRSAWRVVGGDFSQDKAGSESTEMRVVVDAAHHEAKDKKKNDGSNEAGAKLSHVGAASFGGDCEEQAK